MIYAPDGSKYDYYIEEAPVSGYETSYYDSEKQEIKGEGIDLIDNITLTTPENDKNVSVFIKNTYSANKFGQIQLTGQKIWNDYKNYYDYRPEEISLQLYRYTKNQTGQQNQVNLTEVNMIVKEQTDEQEKEPYLVWNKVWNSSNGKDTWTYTVYNLRRYAANGEPYIYKITEPLNELCYYSQKDISVEQEKQEPSTGMITMKQLENGLRRVIKIIFCMLHLFCVLLL